MMDEHADLMPRRRDGSFLSKVKDNKKVILGVSVVLVLLIILVAVIAILAKDKKKHHDEPKISCPDAAKLIEAALANGDLVWQRLATMTDTFGPRLSGTEALESAITWMEQNMKTGENPLENVHKEPVMVPTWVRGFEEAQLISPRPKKLAMLGLGRSVGTPPEGITAAVLVVSSFDELKQKCAEAAGKIVLWDVPFVSYDTTVDYRSGGPSAAAACNAVASLVRSIGPYSLYTPHTGTTSYTPGIAKIPAAAITLEDSAMLHRMQNRGDNVTIKLVMNAQTLNDSLSYNIMGEITGSTHPNEVIVIGGHTDSWDVGQGAMDDGGGVFAAWEAVRLMHKLGLRPKRTVRVVGWTNEENGAKGAAAYADSHANETVFAIESDGGVTKPLGFFFDGSDDGFKVLSDLSSVLKSLGSDSITKGEGGTDVEPLRHKGVPVAGLSVDRARYFWYHHTEADTMDKIDPNELNQCVATLAAMSFCVADRDDTLPRA